MPKDDAGERAPYFRVAPDRDSLIMGHMLLAKSVAGQVWRTAPHALEREELDALAYLGLVEAASRWHDYCSRNGYDPARTDYFLAYAKRRIHGSILDSIRADDYLTRSTRMKAKKLAVAGYGIGASTEAVSAATGLSVYEVRSTAAQISAKPVSLDTLDTDNISDSAAFSVNLHFRRVLSDVAQSMPIYSQVVLAMRYCLGMSLEDVADLLGASLDTVTMIYEDTVTTVFAEFRRTAYEDHLEG